MNSQYFSKEQVEAGELKKLLDFLLTTSYGAGEDYNDIHIYPEDCGAFMVEWVQLPWGHEWGGKFQYVNEDQVVMLEKTFPDNHIEMCFDEEDYQEKLDDFLKDNPGWVKTSYGTWTNKLENEAFLKEYFEETPKVAVSNGTTHETFMEDLKLEQDEQN